ncbi:hypothetical protein B0H16DRAFT_1536354, partial [Mycena metata]
LNYAADLADNDGKWAASWNDLGKALRPLPSSSPLLKSLTMDLGLTVYEDAGDPLLDIDPDFSATLNQLHLPVLTTPGFSLHGVYEAPDFRLRNPAMDFTPLLLKTPLLKHLTLTIDVVCVPVDPNISYLSRLTSFTGSARNCAVILAHTPNIQKLSMWTPGSTLHDVQSMLNLNPFTSAAFSPNLGPSVTSLDVRAIDKTGQTVPYPLHPKLKNSLDLFVAAFPNLTHLRISSFLQPEYRDVFAALPALQHLAVRLSYKVAKGKRRDAPTAVFPSHKYATEINNELRPRIPQLLSVQVRVWGDCTLSSTGCESCDEAQEQYDHAPDLVAEYEFAARKLGEDFVV